MNNENAKVEAKHKLYIGVLSFERDFIMFIAVTMFLISDLVLTFEMYSIIILTMTHMQFNFRIIRELNQNIVCLF